MSALPPPFRHAPPEAETPIEVVWSLPRFEALARALPGVLATPLAPPPLPSMQELAEVSRAIAAAPSVDAAALRLEREARRLTRASESLCVSFDWARRTAWTVHNQIQNESVIELVAQVAGSGRWELIGNALVVPIGQVPTRWVLALRRATPFLRAEAGLVSALCGGVAPTMERLFTLRP